MQQKQKYFGLYQILKLLSIKGNNQWSAKATYRIEKKIFANHISDKGLISRL